MLQVNGAARYWNGTERLREVEKYIEARVLSDFSDMNGGFFNRPTKEAQYSLLRAYQAIMVENLSMCMAAREFYEEDDQKLPKELIDIMLNLDTVFPI